MNTDDKSTKKSEFTKVPEVVKEKCFVIMPIGELDGVYPKDHFKRVYEDIFKPAIEKAGYEANRVDYNKGSNLIQVEIVKDIVESPMVLCDLSTRNPNVLFELGIRQAFDKPVVLVQELGTHRIFDISTINTVDYRKERIFHEVLEDREKIYEAIISTKKDSSNNSIIKMLQISQANISEGSKMNENQEIRLMLKTLMRDMNDIKKDNNLKDDHNNEIYYKKLLYNCSVHTLEHDENQIVDISTIEKFVSRLTPENILHMTSAKKFNFIKRAQRYVQILNDSTEVDTFTKYFLIEKLQHFLSDY